MVAVEKLEPRAMLVPSISSLDLAVDDGTPGDNKSTDPTIRIEFNPDNAECYEVEFDWTNNGQVNARRSGSATGQAQIVLDEDPNVGYGSHTIQARIRVQYEDLTLSPWTEWTDFQFWHLQSSAAVPTADAGGPYVLNHNGSVQLSGQGSVANGAGNVVQSYAWDLDGDGQFDDKSGATPTIGWSEMSTVHGWVPGVHTIGVEVTDLYGNTDVEYAHVDMKAAPSGGGGGGQSPKIDDFTIDVQETGIQFSITASNAVSYRLTVPGTTFDLGASSTRFVTWAEMSSNIEDTTPTFTARANGSVGYDVESKTWHVNYVPRAVVSTDSTVVDYGKTLRLSGFGQDRQTAVDGVWTIDGLTTVPDEHETGTSYGGFGYYVSSVIDVDWLDLVGGLGSSPGQSHTYEFEVTDGAGHSSIGSKVLETGADNVAPVATSHTSISNGKEFTLNVDVTNDAVWRPDEFYYRINVKHDELDESFERDGVGVTADGISETWPVLPFGNYDVVIELYEDVPDGYPEVLSSQTIRVHHQANNEPPDVAGLTFVPEVDGTTTGGDGDVTGTVVDTNLGTGGDYRIEVDTNLDGTSDAETNVTGGPGTGFTVALDDQTIGTYVVNVRAVELTSSGADLVGEWRAVTVSYLPKAVEDTVRVGVEGDTSFSVDDLLGNDLDAGGNGNVSLDGFTAPEEGSLAEVPAGTLTYTGILDASEGETTFDYTIGDDVDPTLTSTVTSKLSRIDDTLDTARERVVPTDGSILTVSGRIDDNEFGAYDVDLVEVTLADGDTLIADLDALSIGKDLFGRLRIFDDLGVELAISDDVANPSDPSDPFLAYTNGSGAAETIWVGVSGYDNDEYDPASENSGTESQVGEYELDLSLLVTTAPVIIGLSLVEDTDTPGDLETVDQRVQGLALFQEDLRRIEFDVNGDGDVDDPEDFDVVLTPEVTGPSSLPFLTGLGLPDFTDTEVNLQVRAVAVDAIGGEVVGAWSTLDFFYRPEAPDGAWELPEQNAGLEECICTVTTPVGSVHVNDDMVVTYKTGELRQQHVLPALDAETRRFLPRYGSLFGLQLVTLEVNVPTENAPDTLIATVDFNGVNHQITHPVDPSELGEKLAFAFDLDVSGLTSGSHDVDVEVLATWGGTYSREVDFTGDTGGVLQLSSGEGSPPTLQLSVNDTADLGFGGDLTVVGQSRIEENGGEATLFRGNGTSARYEDDNGTWQTPRGSFGVLTSLPGGGYEIENDGLVSKYDADGLLVEERDGNGPLMTFTYNDVLGVPRLIEVENRDHRTMTYQYDQGTGVLQSVTDFHGRTYAYAYNGSGRIASVTGPDPDGAGPGTAPVVTYAYDGSGRLSSTTDARGTTTTYVYDGATDRVTAWTVGSNPQVDFESENEARLGTVTGNGIGEVEPYASVVDAAGTTQVRTDDFGYVAETVDRSGNVTTYERDVDGLVTTMIGASPDANDPSLAPVSQYVYDAGGRLTQTTHPDGSTESWTYDADGNLLSYTSQLNRTTTYTYDAANNLLTETNANSEVTTYTYDTDGRLLTVTSPDVDGAGPLGQLVVTNTYDTQANHFNLLEVASRDSLASNDHSKRTFEYDVNGFVTAEIDDVGNRMEYTIDGLGRTTVVTYVNGNPAGGNTTSTYVYSAANDLLSETDALGNVVSYTYDEFGRLETTTLPDPDGAGPLGTATSTNEYDSLGRLTRTTDALGNPTTYEYDANGNLVKVTDALGNETTYGYDDRNRRTTVTDPLGHVTTTFYDVMDRVERLGHPGGPGDVDESFIYDLAGNVLKAYSPDPDGTTGSGDAPVETTASYDNLGRVSVATDELGTTRTYTYHPSGQVKSVSWPLPGGGTATRSYVYDIVGNLVEETDELGRLTTYFYGNNDLLSSVTQPDGLATSYSYGAWNRVENMFAPGQYVEYDYDALGRVVEERDYGDAFPQSGGQSSGTPLVTRTTYDAWGNVTKVEYPDPDGSGPLTAPETTYEYDQLGRLTKTINALGDFTTTTYDELGRVTSETDELSRTTTYEYDRNGRLVESTDPLGNVTKYDYDERGNLVAVNEPGAGGIQTLDDVAFHTPEGIDPTSDERRAIHLDATLGLQGVPSANYGYDWSEQYLEKWLHTPTGHEPDRFYFLVQAGGQTQLWDSNDPYNKEIFDNATLVATFDGTGIYDDPKLLHDASDLAILAARLDTAIGLNGISGYYQNWSGVFNEKWLNSPGGNDYFLLPDGRLFHSRNPSNTSIFSEADLVANFDPTFWTDPSLLHDAPPDSGSMENDPAINAAIAWHLDKNLDLALDASGSDFYNWGGVGDRWVVSHVENGQYYYIIVTPEGAFYRWDGSTGEDFVQDDLLIAVLDKSYNDTLSTLYNANTGQSAPTIDADLYDQNALAGQLKHRLRLAPAASYTQNWAYDNNYAPVELQERWFAGTGNLFYFLTPGGDLYMWHYSHAATYSNGDDIRQDATLLATNLEAKFYNDLSLLSDARPHGSTVDPAYDALAHQIDAGMAFDGVDDSRTDKLGIGEKWFTTVTGAEVYFITKDGEIHRDLGNAEVVDPAPTDPNQNKVITGTELVATLTSDYHTDPSRVYATTADPVELAVIARGIDEALGLENSGLGYWRNFSGEYDEKWLAAADGSWYFILPDGTLYERVLLSANLGTYLDASTPVAKLDPGYWANPALLHDATAGAAFVSPVHENLILSVAQDLLDGGLVHDVRTTRYEYDALDRVTAEIDPAGGVTRYRYDDAGNVTETTDVRGFVTQFDYDALGRHTTTTDAGNGVSTTAYDAAGRVVRTTDELGNDLVYTYDDGNRLLTVGEDGVTPREETRTYDAFGRLSTVEDAFGRTTTYAYDTYGRVASVTDALGNVTTNEYDDLGRLTKTTLPDPDAGGPLAAPETTYEYDLLGRLTKTTDAENGVTTLTYDEVGNVLTETNAVGLVTSYVYDGLNRVTEVVDPATGSTERHFDAAGNLVAVYDAKDDFTYSGHDTLGRVVIQTTEVGTTRFGYDAAGHMTVLVDPIGDATVFEYDELGRRKTETNVLGDTRTFEYDAVGNLTRRTDRLDRVTEYTYEFSFDGGSNYRMTEEDWLDTLGGNLLDTITTTYDANGFVAAIDDGDTGYDYVRDALGRATSITNTDNPGPTVELTSVFDHIGRRTSLAAKVDTTDDFLNTYSHDGLGRTTRIDQTWQIGGNTVADKRVDFGWDASAEPRRSSATRISPGTISSPRPRTGTTPPPAG